jgi:hypothetical protein
LLPDRLLTHANRLVDGEPPGFAPIPIAASLPRTTPLEIERVAFGAALGVLNPDYGRSPVSRIANQFLPASAVYTREVETHRVPWHRAGAFKPAPLRQLPGDVSHIRRIPADFNLDRAIHYDFDGAFAPVDTAATAQIRPARLRADRSANGRECCNCKEKWSVHIFTLALA